MLGDKEEFIVNNMGLVQMVVKKFMYKLNNRTDLTREDLVSEATIGLLKAYDKFDPNFGTKFSTFAVPKITGELMRLFRDNTGMIRIPRDIQSNSRKIYQAGLENEEPSVIAEKLGLSIKEVEEALGRYVNVESFDKVIHQDDGSPVTLEDKLGFEDDFDSNLNIQDLMAGLSERERKIAELAIKDKSQSEIGQALGISQVQISRILQKIREKIGGTPNMSRNNEMLEKAKKLATETDMSLGQIARETGVAYQTVYRYRKTHKESLNVADSIQSVRKEKIQPVGIERYRLDLKDYNPIEQKQDNPIITETNKKIIAGMIEPTPETVEEIKEEVVEIVPVKEEIKSPSINADGYLTLDIKVDTDNVTNQLEEIIKAMKILGFKELNIKIESQRVA